MDGMQYEKLHCNNNTYYLQTHIFQLQYTFYRQLLYCYYEYKFFSSQLLALFASFTLPQFTSSFFVIRKNSLMQKFNIFNTMGFDSITFWNFGGCSCQFGCTQYSACLLLASSLFSILLCSFVAVQFNILITYNQNHHKILMLEIPKYFESVQRANIDERHAFYANLIYLAT